jgi:hypothetical protein
MIAAASFVCCHHEEVSFYIVEVTEITWKGNGVDHKLYMDSFFFSLDLFYFLHTKAVSCCGTVKQNKKGMVDYFDSKTVKLKWCDKLDSSDLERQVRCVHKTPAESNFCSKHCRAHNLPLLKTTVGRGLHQHRGQKH